MIYKVILVRIVISNHIDLKDDKIRELKNRKVNEFIIRQEFSIGRFHYCTVVKSFINHSFMEYDTNSDLLLYQFVSVFICRLLSNYFYNVDIVKEEI